MQKIFAVLDDEMTFQMRFRLVLQRVGISTQYFHTFTNAEDFVKAYLEAKAKGEAFDIIFCDINLKTSNGLDLVKEIREKLNGHPSVIAVISTSALVSDIEKARKYGANAYIVKSGKLETFSNRMKSFKAKCLDDDCKGFTVFDEA